MWSNVTTPAELAGAAEAAREEALRPLPRPAEAASMSEPEFDLAACLAQARAGDQLAARQLIDHVYPLVIRIVRRNLPRRDSEEDMAQEIFLKIFSSLGTFKGIAPFEHWVSRIAVNACMNRIRGEKSRPELRWADLPEAQADALDLVSSGKELRPDEELSARDFVEHLLSALSPEDALVIRMLEMEELTVKEISARTGWSSALVRVRAFRARQKLNKNFAQLWKGAKE